MITAFQKLRSISLNKGLWLAIVSVLVWTFQAKAQNINENLVNEVSYTYQLTDIGDNRYTCYGTLDISLSLPDNVDMVFLERTGNLIRFINRPVVFSLKSAHPGNTTFISNSHVSWNSLFRVYVRFLDGTGEFSPTYAINDYIDESDLDLLKQTAGIESVVDTPVELIIDGNNLIVETQYAVDLSIFDMSGRCLFSGKLRHSTAISLDDAHSDIIAVRYTYNNITKTKKIRLR